MNITNVIFSIGTNDVLKSPESTSRLYIPISNLLRKAKMLFQCKIHFQDLIPIPNQPAGVADAVYKFNGVAEKACRAEKCYLIQVFREFLRCNNFSKFYYVKKNGIIDIHPNKVGQSILAKSYISIVRDYFNPRSRF